MPIKELKTIGPNQQLAVWQIEEGVEELLEMIEISHADKLVLDGFKLTSRKKEWLSSRLLLQQLIGYYPQLAYSANGKPFLESKSHYVSISHTKGFAAVSVSDKPTALDIELCSDRVLKVAKRFVHPDEEGFIEPHKRKEYLTLLWSAKETLYKYFDEYGVIFKEQFMVSPIKIADSGNLNCQFLSGDRLQHLELAYEVNNEFTLVYC